jgi:hypothetical protein
MHTDPSGHCAFIGIDTALCIGLGLTFLAMAGGVTAATPQGQIAINDAAQSMEDAIQNINTGVQAAQTQALSTVVQAATTLAEQAWQPEGFSVDAPSTGSELLIFVVTSASCFLNTANGFSLRTPRVEDLYRLGPQVVSVVQGLVSTGHPWPEDDQLRVYAANMSQQLDRNMQAAGVTRPPGNEAHHIVAWRDMNAAGSRAILDDPQVAIGINEAINGVYLPKDGTVYTIGEARHRSIHTDSYYREVELRLNSVPRTRNAVSRELERLADEIQRGVFRPR